MEEKKTEFSKQEKLELEEKALQALLQCGARFNVPLKLQYKEAPFYVRWWNKWFRNFPIVWRNRTIPKAWDVTVEDIPDLVDSTIVKTYMRHFVLKPLYLGTIDMIRLKELEIEYSEESIQDDAIKKSQELMKHTRLMAEICAIALLNTSKVTDPFYKEVRELQEFLLDHLTCARLENLCGKIRQMMDPAGFTNSIRSILVIPQKTKPKNPNRVE